MFELAMPGSAWSERAHIAQWVFRDRLGLDVHLVRSPKRDRATLRGPDGRTITFPDRDLGHWDARWLVPESLTDFQLQVVSNGLPRWARDACPSGYVRSGEDGCISESANGLELDVDVHAIIFLLLTRYDEALAIRRDEYSRPLTQDQVLPRAGLQRRPVVDQLIELLRGAINYLWPLWPTRRTRFSVESTHDVDQLFAFVTCSPYEFAKVLAHSAARHGLGDASRVARDYTRTKCAGPSADPSNTFSWIMDQSEKRGMSSRFFFQTSLSGVDRAWKRNVYNLLDDAPQDILRNILSRGHDVGLHPSFASSDIVELRKEKNYLLRALEKSGHSGNRRVGNRQHFLRFDPIHSPVNWSAAGFDYDSTIGYPDDVGFRAGTCHPYPLYDLRGRRSLPVIERPLILMDATLIRPQYMGINLRSEGGYSEAANLVTNLSDECRRVGGQFTILFHNNVLSAPAAKELFIHCLDS